MRTDYIEIHTSSDLQARPNAGSLHHTSTHRFQHSIVQDHAWESLQDFIRRQVHANALGKPTTLRHGKVRLPPLETVPISNERFRHLGACNSFSFVCPSCNAVKSPAYFEQKSIRRHLAGRKVSIPLCLCRCIINRPDVNPSPTLSSIPSLKLKCTKVM